MGIPSEHSAYQDGLTVVACTCSTDDCIARRLYSPPLSIIMMLIKIKRLEPKQGVITYMYIPAVLIPANAIKVRSSSQAIKLKMIKRSRHPFALLK